MVGRWNPPQKPSLDVSIRLRFDAKEGINNLLLGRLYTTQLIVHSIPLLAILVRKLEQPLNKSTP